MTAQDRITLFLTEATMSASEAEKILDLTGEWDPLSLKKAYKKAALKNHPDLGGSAEDMIRVTAAYQLLGKLGPSKGKAAQARAAADRKKSEDEKYQMVKETMDANFRPDKFAQYFTKQTGKAFTLEKDDEKNVSGSYQRDLVWTSSDGETVFSLQLYVSSYRMQWVKALGGGDDAIAFSVMVQPEVLHDNRKSKMRKKNWDFSSSKSTLTDPSKTFPKASIKKMMAGNDKSRKFKKRDMILGLEKKLNARIEYSGSQVWAYIPVTDQYQINIYRSTMMGTASWSTHSVFEYPDKQNKPFKRKSYKPSKHAYAMETEDLIKNLAQLQKKKFSSPQKLANATSDAFRDALEKAKG